MNKEAYKGMKIATKPVIYEIEILWVEKEVPKEQEANFTEWLIGQVNECPCGKNHEYFAYSENYVDDIGVLFYIKTQNK